ncbi:esterase/lipase family protein [Larkinella rosea]|uniref:Alpha/beta hydrolase n=1 Tax=Larkinella rosea TaxID=2025312 RepID=A0A3P1BZM0_9BACT|nr:alpha/beta hydrolase [Larkinella rosea]RRB06527.1 alpha/beta hydrolase [Larkinella rosea]
MSNPLVLIHGYSDVPESFKNWEKSLSDRGFDVANVHVCGYRSLTNEVTIKDIAEGFDRALRLRAGLNADEPFDAIVHSTGMLVIRAWLTTYAKQEKRKRRLKRLIAIAPASFGSPLAHKGRSWLGAIFKGNRSLGPDFMDAGDLILDGLELASRYTWDLAHRDLLSDEVFYGPDDNTPYVFTFCGATNYKGLQGLVTNPDGTDGTVRWAGCSLNTRKIILNLTTEDDDTTVKRLDFGQWRNDRRSNFQIPFIPIAGLNHGSIIENPTEELVDLVVKALAVSTSEEFQEWNKTAIQQTEVTLKSMVPWQQFIVRAVDERGDPITDYHVRFNAGYKDSPSDLKPLDVDVHVYSGDKSLRSFHFDLKKLDLENLARLRIEVIASSGTDLVRYYGHIDSDGTEDADKNTKQSAASHWTAVFDMGQMLSNSEVKLFYPFTTTLIELQLNREPEAWLPNGTKVTWFVEK